jgi:hypothetical protein
MAKQFYDSGKGQMRPSNFTRTAHDNLRLPGGKRLQEASDSELAAVVTKLGIEGGGSSAGRATNADLYAGHLETVGNAARDRAIEDFLRN